MDLILIWKDTYVYLRHHTNKARVGGLGLDQDDIDM